MYVEFNTKFLSNSAVEKTYLRHPQFPKPGLTGIYDFYMSGTSKDVFKGEVCIRYFMNLTPFKKSPASIAGYLQNINEFGLINNQSDMRLSWYLLEIHDWSRFLRYDPYNKGKLFNMLLCALMVQTCCRLL